MVWVALVLMALLLPASHIGLACQPLRTPLVARLGERGFRGGYSLIAIAALAALIAAYLAAPRVPVPALPGAGWLALPVTLIALVLVVAGYLGPKPTGVGFQNGLYRTLGQPTGVLRVTRHPIQAGVALWAASHLAAVGELGGALVFASLLALAVGGTVHLDAKLARRYPAAWPAFASATSAIPGAAILTGRQPLKPGEVGWLAPLAGLAAWALLLASHAALFGAAPGPV